MATLPNRYGYKVDATTGAILEKHINPINTIGMILSDVDYDGTKYEYKNGEFVLKPEPEAPPVYVPTFEEVKARVTMELTNKATYEFFKKRDEIRWVDGIGWDCGEQDIANFVAAFTLLKDDVEVWVAGGSVGAEPQTGYRVWISETDKEFRMFTVEQMRIVHQAVRASQVQAYVWYETQLSTDAAKIAACTTKEELEALVAPVA